VLLGRVESSGRVYDSQNRLLAKGAGVGNTYLCKIHQELRADPGVPDSDELCAFIQSITRSTGSSVEKWEGERNMIDMLELVKRYYYDPYTGGSNSIKYVLPAILQRSEYLQRKYGEPNYGAEGGIPGFNFQNRAWIVWKNGIVQDPCRLLPRLFQDIDPTDEELLSESDELKDGGATMTAYARMQFEEMGDAERRHLHDALLRYCELDTMAMVMIYEKWREVKNVFEAFEVRTNALSVCTERSDP